MTAPSNPVFWGALLTGLAVAAVFDVISWHSALWIFGGAGVGSATVALIQKGRTRAR